MDYKTHYDRLIQRGKSRVLECYTETHHIIPKCIGGTDDPKNLVELTPEEHYIAHLLLVKIFPDKPKLLYAANMMSNRNNKTYGVFRKRFAELVSLQKTGVKHNEESRKKMSLARKGKKKTTSHKRKISDAKKIKIEYKGKFYSGYKELLEKTRVSRHNYLKYYCNGIDPEPFIDNNTWGMTKQLKENHRRPVKGKVWINDGKNERYIAKHEPLPDNWKYGRLKRENKCSNR